MKIKHRSIPNLARFRFAWGIRSPQCSIFCRSGFASERLLRWLFARRKKKKKQTSFSHSHSHPHSQFFLLLIFFSRIFRRVFSCFFFLQVMAEMEDATPISFRRMKEVRVLDPEPSVICSSGSVFLSPTPSARRVLQVVALESALVSADAVDLEWKM